MSDHASAPSEGTHPPRSGPQPLLIRRRWTLLSVCRRRHDFSPGDDRAAVALFLKFIVGKPTMLIVAFACMPFFHCTDLEKCSSFTHFRLPRNFFCSFLNAGSSARLKTSSSAITRMNCCNTFHLIWLPTLRGSTRSQDVAGLLVGLRCVSVCLHSLNQPL